jgi:hypothetical protein
MTQVENMNLDEETISQVGLKLSNEHVNAQLATGSRVFEYPGLDKVFVMESDLYGNVMPQDSCFLAFYGPHGLIGKHLKVDVLRNSSISDIKTIVERNSEG